MIRAAVGFALLLGVPPRAAAPPAPAAEPEVHEGPQWAAFGHIAGEAKLSRIRGRAAR